MESALKHNTIVEGCSHFRACVELDGTEHWRVYYTLVGRQVTCPSELACELVEDLLGWLLGTRKTPKPHIPFSLEKKASYLFKGTERVQYLEGPGVSGDKAQREARRKRRLEMLELFENEE